MNKLSWISTNLACLILLIASNGSAQAQFTFLGPTPYLSAADSPFDMSGLGTTFFLEDFEDFEINTPGILDAFAAVTFGSSVDGDDGMIDGNGDIGGSGAGSPTGCSLTICSLTSRFLFDDMTFGKYPLRVGFVLTSANDLGLLFRVYDSAGNSATWDLSAYSFDSQLVYDDTFFGVISPIGITEVSVLSAERRPPFPIQVGLRIDHLQFGVPEPATVSWLLILLGIGNRRCRNRQSR